MFVVFLFVGLAGADGLPGVPGPPGSVGVVSETSDTEVRYLYNVIIFNTHFADYLHSFRLLMLLKDIVKKTFVL